MRTCFRLALFVGFSVFLAASAPEGIRLATHYDAMDVEKHWLSGRHVDWRTGDPDRGKAGKTHCSAFVAAACERLGIYILRPPEHGQKNLANAQFQWLAEKGVEQGWAPVASAFEAQNFANKGLVVIVAFLNPDPRKPGHIALVRPCEKPDPALQSEGPQIIQAGGTNYASTTTKRGFRQHRGAWIDAEHHQIRFFAHAVPAQ
jgi:hypothetical protein